MNVVRVFASTVHKESTWPSREKRDLWTKILLGESVSVLAGHAVVVDVLQLPMFT